MKISKILVLLVLLVAGISFSIGPRTKKELTRNRSRNTSRISDTNSRNRCTSSSCQGDIVDEYIPQ